eukprot:scaffold12244_cov216-Isochrysis_galbana.AAC.14
MCHQVVHPVEGARAPRRAAAAAAAAAPDRPAAAITRQGVWPHALGAAAQPTRGGGRMGRRALGSSHHRGQRRVVDRDGHVRVL